MTNEPRVLPTNATRVFLGLGSNLGDRRQHLIDAIRGLPDVVGVSSLYETEPLGGPDGQTDHLNCVVELRTTLTARELLARAQSLEEEAQRVRTVRNGPRTLDIDILLFGELVIDEIDLQVPHPRMWERNFVIQPLLDLAPDLKTRANKTAPAPGDVRRIATNWN